MGDDFARQVGDMSDASKHVDKPAEDSAPLAASFPVSVAALSASLVQAQAAIQAMMSSTAGAHVAGLPPDSTKQPAIHNPVQFSLALEVLEQAVSIAHALKASEDMAHASHGTSSVAANDGGQLAFAACLVRTP